MRVDRYFGEDAEAGRRDEHRHFPKTGERRSGRRGDFIVVRRRWSASDRVAKPVHPHSRDLPVVADRDTRLFTAEWERRWGWQEGLGGRLVGEDQHGDSNDEHGHNRRHAPKPELGQSLSVHARIVPTQVLTASVVS
jgi:hypothetical protein